MSKIEFIAYIPPLKSAITLDGQGDGGQIKLEIPRSHVHELLRLQGLTQQALKVTIEPEV